MYVPNRVFMERLKKLDKRLGCEYVKSHGHFVINYQRPYGQPVPITMVKADNGGFRQPDNRDLDFLKQGDLEREDMKTKLQKSAKYMEDVREKAKRDAKDNIRHMTLDGKIQLANNLSRIAGGGKGNATFRRVTPKSKGEVF